MRECAIAIVVVALGGCAEARLGQLVLSDAGPITQADGAPGGDGAAIADASGPTPDACVPQTGNVLQNGDFEGGPNGDWTEMSGSSYDLITNESELQVGFSHSGQFFAWLGGLDNGGVDQLWQDVTIPQSATEAVWSGMRILGTEETIGSNDDITVEVRSTSGQTLETLVVWSTADVIDVWEPFQFNLTSYAGQTIRLHFRSELNATLNTNFFFDSFSLDVTACQ